MADLGDVVKGVKDALIPELRDLKRETEGLTTMMKAQQEVDAAHFESLVNRIEAQEGRLKDLRGDIGGRLNDLRGDIDGRLKDLRGDIGGRLNDLRGIVDGHLGGLRGDIDGRLSGLRGDISDLRQDVRELRSYVFGLRRSESEPAATSEGLEAPL